MSDFKKNLIRARSHLVFLVGLCLAFGLVIALELWEPVGGKSKNMLASSPIVSSQDRPGMPAPQELQAIEMQWARTAWKYFENNYHPETGLVNSVDNYSATTLWDLSSYMMGMISAHRLGIVSSDTFYTRTSKLLDSLAQLELFDGKLPNKVYNARSLAMVDYTNQAIEDGVGWSAIDIGRFLVPINILLRSYPEFTRAANTVLDQWDLSAMVSNSQLMGARWEDNGEIEANVEYVQEGRLGYEEYAAKSMSLGGWDVSRARDYEDTLNLIDIYGVEVAIDTRDARQFGAHNYVVTEPYVLDGIEYGWDWRSAELAWRVYQVQERRFQETGILTAVSEDNIDQAPHFVYNTIYTNGKVWNAITEDGKDASDYRTLSTKAAFGMHVLFESAYTEKLMNRLHANFDAERGWYSGIYEASNEPNAVITANTNGIILETLAFKKFGPLLQRRSIEKVQVAEND